MLSARSLLYVLAIFSVAQAAVVTTSSKDVTIAATGPAPAVNITSLASPPHPFLDVSVAALSPDASDRVVLGALSSNAAIAVAACTYGGPYACISVGVGAVIASFLELWLFSSNGPLLPPAAAGPARTLPLIDARWQQSAGCSIGCQLRAGVQEGTWTHFANATVGDAVHTMHYYRAGTVNGLKAVPVAHAGAPGAARRSDADDVSGIVTTYFWTDGVENAWSSFGTDETQNVENAIVSYMERDNYNAVCADLQDSDGLLDAGLMTVGLNNDVLVPSNLQGALQNCASIEGE